MSVPRVRLLDLLKTRCELFSTTFNPEGIRTGNKILRQRLKGPALASYYPPKLWTMREFQDSFKDLHLLTDNEPELDRLDHLRRLKQRGKGASAGSTCQVEEEKINDRNYERRTRIELYYYCIEEGQKYIRSLWTRTPFPPSLAVSSSFCRCPIPQILRKVLFPVLKLARRDQCSISLLTFMWWLDGLGFRWSTGLSVLLGRCQRNPGVTT